MAEFRMPLMLADHKRGYLTFEATKRHRDRADSNHQQTLERLAARGGLNAGEMLCILEDRAGGTWRLPALSELAPFGQLELPEGAQP